MLTAFCLCELYVYYLLACSILSPTISLFYDTSFDLQCLYRKLHVLFFFTVFLHHYIALFSRKNIGRYLPSLVWYGTHYFVAIYIINHYIFFIIYNQKV